MSVPPQSSYCWRAAILEGPRTCNPIELSSGVKHADETDYRAEGLSSLAVRRKYRSDGFFTPTSHVPVNRLLLPNWRLGYERSIVVEIGSIQVAYAQRGDGDFRHFKNSGSGWVGRSDSPDRLTELTGPNGRTGWLLVTAEDEIERYDANGTLLSITDRRGRRQNLAYQNGLLASVTDSSGRSLKFSYTGSRLTGVTLPGSGTLQYVFDDSGFLGSAIYPDGQSKQYVYNEPANTPSDLGNAAYMAMLTGLIDENGSRYATYQYNRGFYAVSSVHAGGADSTAVSTTQGFGASAIDAYGTQRSYTFTTVNGISKLTGVSQPGGSGCNSASSAITYDAGGNVASRTDFAGHKTCYASDSRGLETRRAEGLPSNANCTSALSSPPAPTAVYPARVVSTQWHPDWRLEARRAEPRKITTWVYNGQPDPTAGGSVASCAPGDALLPDGKPIAVLCKRVEQATTDTTGASGFSATVSGAPRTWAYTYNGFGQVLSANGPRTDVNDTTTYAYYTSTTSEHTLGDLESVTDPLGHVTRYTRYDPNGRPLTIVDANGLTTTLSYSPRGWLKTREVGSELTAYDYDAVGQLKKVTAPDGSWVGYDYDPAHRLTDVYDNLGNRIAYTLDAAGNKLKEEVSDPSGNLVRSQTRVYDALSRLQNIILPE